MKLKTSFNNFKRIHRTGNINQFFFTKCNNYKLVENLYKFILVKNSFIFNLEKGVIRGRYTIIGYNPDKIINIQNNKIVIDNLKNKKVLKLIPGFSE